ncbi:cytochrome P450 [Durotheca rogersii]|uniref:cytochrome P450 n=1 Tax=Durotheca rogersii TaxID=419775 RepID=UPI00221F2869|nr:cytochrome P450 [Durotheca rogersii]KAI5864115.1 cytochrome P450 [Durotheca rogersii]
MAAFAQGSSSSSEAALASRAKWAYVIAGGAVAALVASLIVDLFGAAPLPHRALRVALSGAGAALQAALGGAHRRHAAAAARGCAASAPAFPGDFTGARFLLRTAHGIRTHTLLAGLRALLRRRGDGGGLGHTFAHVAFPSLRRRRVLVTDEPANVRAVLAARFDHWRIPRDRVAAFLPVLGPHSVFAADGAAWRRARAALRPAFVRDQVADLRRFERHVDRLVARLRRDAAAAPRARVDLQAAFLLLTTDTISDFMLGRSTGLLRARDGGEEAAAGARFGRCFDVAMQKIANRARLGRLARLLRDRELDESVAFMHAFVDRYVGEVRRARQEEEEEEAAEKREARGSGVKDDEEGDGDGDGDDDKRYVFLNELLRTGEPDEVIRDHLMSIFTAGRDTTTSALSYLFFELSRRPDVAAAIRREAAQAGLAAGRTPTWQQLRDLRYLGWAVKEALRLNPPVPTNARQAVCDTVLPLGGGPDGTSPLFVPQGTVVRYVPWTMHRRHDLYGPDADEFRPERWETLKPTYEYVPFNAGPRICVGQQFALTQIAFVTLRLLQAFSAIERQDDRPFVQKFGVNTSLLHGCWVSLTPA